MRTTNTVPYTNARREGRTNPDLVEYIRPDDPRRRRPRYVENREDRRAYGLRVPVAAGTRRNPVSRNQRRRAGVSK